MNYRLAQILAETSLTGSGTHTEDILVKDPISRLIIGVRENTGGNNMSAQQAANITKIELVDGGDVLHSLNGLENQALCIYDRRVNTMNHSGLIADSSMYATFGIDFGRYLFDPQLAFLPSQFNNPQLKISYDVDVARTDATALLLEIWAQCFDEKTVSPVGFLTAEEHQSWSLSAAGAYEYIKLPTDYPYRRMLIRGYRADYEPWYQVIEARLDEDNNKRVVFDVDLEDYHRVMKGEWLPVIEQFAGYFHGAAGYIKYVTPTDYYMIAAALPISATDVFVAYPARGGKLDIQASASTFCLGTVQGWCPNHCFDFTFGNPNDLDDLYDVTRVGSLRLRLKSGSSTSGDVGVVIQQMRRY